MLDLIISFEHCRCITDLSVNIVPKSNIRQSKGAIHWLSETLETDNCGRQRGHRYIQSSSAVPESARECIPSAYRSPLEAKAVVSVKEEADAASSWCTELEESYGWINMITKYCYF